MGTIFLNKPVKPAALRALLSSLDRGARPLIGFGAEVIILSPGSTTRGPSPPSPGCLLHFFNGDDRPCPATDAQFCKQCGQYGWVDGCFRHIQLLAYDLRLLRSPHRHTQQHTEIVAGQRSTDSSASEMGVAVRFEASYARRPELIHRRSTGSYSQRAMVPGEDDRMEACRAASPFGFYAACSGRLPKTRQRIGTLSRAVSQKRSARRTVRARHIQADQENQIKTQNSLSRALLVWPLISYPPSRQINGTNLFRANGPCQWLPEKADDHLQ